EGGAAPRGTDGLAVVGCVGAAPVLLTAVGLLALTTGFGPGLDVGPARPALVGLVTTFFSLVSELASRFAGADTGAGLFRFAPACSGCFVCAGVSRTGFLSAVPFEGGA